MFISLLKTVGYTIVFNHSEHSQRSITIQNHLQQQTSTYNHPLPPTTTQKIQNLSQTLTLIIP